MSDKSDAQLIQERLDRSSPQQNPTDLENRLQQLKKDIETKGVATLYLQRGARGEIVGFTVLKSETVEESGDGDFVQHIEKQTPAVRLSSAEVLRIDVRANAKPEAAQPDPTDQKPKSKTARQ